MQIHKTYAYFKLFSIYSLKQQPITTQYLRLQTKIEEGQLIAISYFTYRSTGKTKLSLFFNLFLTILVKQNYHSLFFNLFVTILLFFCDYVQNWNMEVYGTPSTRKTLLVKGRQHAFVRKITARLLVQ